MKRITIYFLATTLIAVLLHTGCKKENQKPSTVVKVSYPKVNLVGDAILVLNRGDAFNDPGASWYDSTTAESGTIKATATVPTSADTIVVITYTAKNKNGFTTSITRTVAVTGISDAYDISGVYLRTANGDTANITKIGRGLFQTDNLGGNVFLDVAFFMVKTDSTPIFPSQYLVNSAESAAFQGAEIDYSPTPPTVTISYVVIANQYATAVRTFEKQ